MNQVTFGASSVAQIRKEQPKVSISARLTPALKQGLDGVLAEERRTPENSDLTLSDVLEYVLARGLDEYWARHELGTRLQVLEDAMGGNSRAVLLMVLRAGLDALDASHRPTT